MPLLDSSVLLNASGVCRTVSLFYETHQPGSVPVFTFNPNPPAGAAGLIKFRDIYLLHCVDDPTENSMAEAVFGDYKYWVKISETPLIQPYVEELRNVATIKRKEIAFKAIVDEAKNGRSKFTAAKYLIEEPWLPKDWRTKKNNRDTSRQAAHAISSDVDRLKAEGYFN